MNFRAEFAQIVIQVVSERVVIIDEQDHRFLHVRRARSPLSIAARLVERLLILELGVGVGDDAGAGVDEDFFAFHHDGADDDAGVQIAIVAEIADGAGVKAALLRFQLADDLHGANLRRAGNRAGGEGRDEQIEGRFCPAAKLPRTLETMWITWE